MNRIEKLLQKFCPDGVEFKALGELGEFANIGVDKKIIAGQKEITLLNFVDIMRNKYIDKSIPQMKVTAKKLKNALAKKAIFLLHHRVKLLMK